MEYLNEWSFTIFTLYLWPKFLEVEFPWKRVNSYVTLLNIAVFPSASAGHPHRIPTTTFREVPISREISSIKCFKLLQLFPSYLFQLTLRRPFCLGLRTQKVVLSSTKVYTEKMNRTGSPIKTLFTLRFPRFLEWRIRGLGKAKSMLKWRETTGKEHCLQRSGTLQASLQPASLLQSWVSKNMKVKPPPRENSHWRKTYNHLRCSQGLQYEAQKWG